MNRPYILGLILARGGSKRLPGKNLRPFLRKPLLAHTCEAALQSATLDRTVLSTDNVDIAAVGKAYGVDVPFLRPAHLATDHATSHDAVRHALKTIEHKHQQRPDIVVLLQPTSPLRTALHIDQAVELLLSTKADSVVSVCPAGSQNMPEAVGRILLEGRLLPLSSATQKDIHHQWVQLNGAVYVLRTHLLTGDGDMFGNDCRAFLMKEDESVDIDTMEDFVEAERILQQRATST
jgi:CMP-N-acetylneuraminic acid synthetase